MNLCLGRDFSGVPVATGGGTSCWKLDDEDAAAAELSGQIEDDLIAGNDSQFEINNSEILLDWKFNYHTNPMRIPIERGLHTGLPMVIPRKCPWISDNSRDAWRRGRSQRRGQNGEGKFVGGGGEPSAEEECDFPANGANKWNNSMYKGGLNLTEIPPLRVLVASTHACFCRVRHYLLWKSH